MHRRSRTILTVVSLALAGSATAVAGNGHWQNYHARPSVVPPPHRHCDDDHGARCKPKHGHGNGHGGHAQHDADNSRDADNNNDDEG